MNSQLN